MEDLINLTKATKRIHNLHSLTTGLISNAKTIESVCKTFHTPTEGQHDFASIGNLLQKFIGPIVKSGANGTTTVPNVSQVNSFIKTAVTLSGKMSQLSNNEQLNAFSGCLVTGILSCIIEQLKKKVEREFDLFVKDFSSVLEKFKLAFPASLLSSMNPLMEFVNSNKEELNISNMISKMTTFLTQYPKVVLKELMDFETLAAETLNLQNLKKFMSVGTNREEKKQLIRESFTKFFKEANDLEKAFVSIASPDFIEIVLQPLFTLMEGFKNVLKELVSNLKVLDEFPKLVREMVQFLLNSDTRLVRIFKPPPLIACFCGCFIGSPDLVAQLKAELQQLKQSINLKIIEDFVGNLATTVKQTVGQEEAKIRTLIQTLEAQLKSSKGLKESLSKQNKVFEQLNTEIKYMEENIMHELDELLDSPVVRKLEDFKDKVVGVFTGLFGLGKGNKE